MPKLQEIKTKSGNRFMITVPNDMVEQKKWNKSQKLLFIWNERGNIEITDNIK